MSIPTQCEHRGVGIHVFQTPERVAIVRAAIDAVFAMTNPTMLMTYLVSSENPPEARLFAAARLRAIHELAAESRISRPNINLVDVDAHIAGLDSLDWISPWRFSSLLDSTERDAVLRERPLTDAEIASAQRQAQCMGLGSAD